MLIQQEQAERVKWLLLYRALDMSESTVLAWDKLIARTQYPFLPDTVAARDQSFQKKVRDWLSGGPVTIQAEGYVSSGRLRDGR